VDWAEEHLFDRRSIVHEHELWYYTLEFARGHRLALAEIKHETANRPYLREAPDQITRRDVLAREWAIVQLARNGMRSRAPLAPDSNQNDDTLAEDQKIALQRILRSRDFVTLFRGGAGTGKSYVLRRVQEALHGSGHTTHVLAPQRQQVLDLSKAGLSGMQTVAEFLGRGSLANKAVVIVDEAGQIGARQLLDLLKLVQSRGGRVLLSGDTRQHGSVAASDALRAIERYSGVEPVELNEIRRQDPKRARDQAERTRIGEYRAAVKEASQGSVEASFDRLEQLGSITETGALQLRDELASAYVELAKNRESVIVVSQTRAEIEEVNERIRCHLRENGLLAGVEENLTSLRQIDLTTAQKSDRRYYPEDHVVVFNQKIGGCSARGYRAPPWNYEARSRDRQRPFTAGNKAEALGRNQYLPASETRALSRRPPATQSQRRDEYRSQTGERRDRDDFEDQTRRRHRPQRWPNIARQLPPVRSRVCRHFLRLARQNG
jgi:ATP-dependent exoDNAse (exonuclease V) alpha subunit